MNPIHFPVHTYQDFIEPIHELMKIRAAMIYGQSCTFDLSHSILLSPLLLCGTAALYKSSKEAGVDVSIRRPHNKEMDNYLKVIGYPDGFYNEGLTFEARRKLASLRSYNYVPLVCFDASVKESKLREQLLSGFDNLLDRQFKLPTNRLDGQRYVISELTDNIGNHAIKGTGMVMAHYRKSFNCIDISIADTGIGLRGSYIPLSGNISDTVAITKAMRGESTKGDGDRGWGLRTSSRMLVEGMGGSFLLWSGAACFINTPSGRSVIEIQDGTSFPGTYLAVRIPTHGDPTFNHGKYH